MYEGINNTLNLSSDNIPVKSMTAFLCSNTSLNPRLSNHAQRDCAVAMQYASAIKMHMVQGEGNSRRCGEEQ